MVAATGLAPRPADQPSELMTGPFRFSHRPNRADEIQWREWGERAFGERSFWAAEGGFFDRVRSEQDVGALRYRDQPFELNALAARVLLDLASAAAERSWRAHAESVLAMLSPVAGRWGAAGATFAMAAEEYFQPPVRTVVVGDVTAAAPLREAALALPLPAHRVWSMPEGGRLDAEQFPAQPAPAAYLCTGRGRSPAITAGEEQQPALARLL